MKQNEEQQSKAPGKIKILFLAANPKFTEPLKLDEEIRVIEEKIREGEYRDSIELVSAWAVRFDDLQRSLLEQKPHIVHFSGHGRCTGEILLLDKDGNPKPVSPRAIQSLFTILKDNIRVVFFNACYTRKQAQAIRKEIDCVIGMSTYISDQSATIFDASFYSALSFGRSVKEAFELGKTALVAGKSLDEQAEKNLDERAPKLLTKAGIDPSQIFLLRPTQAPGDNNGDNNETLYIIDGAIDHEKAIGLVETANNPEKRKSVINCLVNEIPKRKDHTERYWIYIALGKIGGERAKDAIKKGLSEPNEFARNGAVKAMDLIYNRLHN